LGDLERNHTTFASGIPHDIVSSICNIESTSTIGTIFTTWTDTIIVLSELCITLTLSLYTLLPPPHNTTQINTDNKYNNNIPIIIIITIANIDNSILRFTIHDSRFTISNLYPYLSLFLFITHQYTKIHFSIYRLLHLFCMQKHLVFILFHQLFMNYLFFYLFTTFYLFYYF